MSGVSAEWSAAGRLHHGAAQRAEHRGQLQHPDLADRCHHDLLYLSGANLPIQLLVFVGGLVFSKS